MRRLPHPVWILFALVPSTAAASGLTPAQKSSGSGLALWIWGLANLSYAGMRAQGHPGVFWRIIAFLFGFPGTLVSLIAIREGGQRAYGVDLPRRQNSTDPAARD